MKQNKNPILKEMKLVHNWTENTYKQYQIALESYTTFHDMTFTELLQEAEKDEETITKTGKRKIKQRLLQYQIHLQEEKQFKPNSTKAYLSKICKIYKYHDIDLPDLPKIRCPNMENYQDIPKYKEIQKAIFTSRPKMKAIITFIASSGLRRGDTANLTIGDFINATREYHQDNYNNLSELLTILDTEKQIIIPTWNITSQKTGIQHITFSSNESTYYIVELLKERNKREKLTPEHTIFNVQPNTITHNFKKINNRLGYGMKDTRVYFHPHALRKYFSTTLTNNDVDYLATEFMVGHQLRGSSRAYYFANPKKLKNKYMRVMDHLNFTMNVNYCDINSKEREELLLMRRQYDEIRGEMRELREYVRQKQRLNELAHEYGLE
jgi:integrase